MTIKVIGAGLARTGTRGRGEEVFLESIDLLLIFSKILDGDIAKQGGQDAKRS